MWPNQYIFPNVQPPLTGEVAANIDDRTRTDPNPDHRVGDHITDDQTCMGVQTDIRAKANDIGALAETHHRNRGVNAAPAAHGVDARMRQRAIWNPQYLRHLLSPRHIPIIDFKRRLQDPRVCADRRSDSNFCLSADSFVIPCSSSLIFFSN